jgi:hypothetical protein
MTANGVRSTIAALIFLLPLAVPVTPAGAVEDKSARIKSLGGDAVEGIIPDFYTDFMNNPAILADKDRTEIIYRFVDADLDPLPFFWPDRNWDLERPDNHYFSYLHSADIFWGRKPGQWKFALSAVWRFDRSERSNPEYQRDYNSRYGIAISESRADIWRLDLTAAKKLTGGTMLGVRAGSYELYSYDRRQSLSQDERFRITDAVRKIAQRQTYERRSGSVNRRLAAYVEVGIRSEEKRSEFSELSFRLSRVSNNAYDSFSRTELDKLYGEFDGITYLTDQRFRQTIFSNGMEGDSWIFRFGGRHGSAWGYIFSAAASYERCGHNGSRWDSYEELDHDYVSEDRSESMETFETAGEGTFDRISGNVKAGRRFSLTRHLDLYLGAALFGTHTGWDYDPVTEVMWRASEDDDFNLTESSDKSAISYRFSSASLYLPAAVEFTPASFFTYYLSISPKVKLNVLSENVGLPENMVPEYISYLCGNEMTTTDIYTNQEVSTGFRLNYREKLFIDIYTRGYLLPDLRLDMLEINTGYRF